MTSRQKVRSASLLFSLFLIAGCGSDTPTAPTATPTPTSDFIAVTSIVPAAGTTLNAGERVTFTAVVTCTLVSSNGGFAAMVLQDQANRLLINEGDVQSQSAIQRGTTTLTLSQTIRIPESGSTVRALFPLFVNESTSTRAVAVQNYSVR